MANNPYPVGSGWWFNVVGGTIVAQQWGLPLQLAGLDLTTVMANGWFPGVVSGQLPAIPGTPAGSTAAYDPNYYTQTATNTLAGQQVNVAYGAPVAVPLAQAQACALSQLAANRWAAQTAGITVDGILVDTTPESRTLVASARAYADAQAAAGNTSVAVAFKQSNGQFAALTQAQIDAIDTAFGAYVEACFANEAVIAGQVAAAATVAAVQAISLDTGWPART
jgi:hypothetical protein